MASDEELRERYRDTIDWLRSTPNIGLKAVATLAIVIWQAHATYKATGRQIELVFLGPRPSSVLRDHFRWGVRIAELWSRTNVPELVRSANSPEAARQAMLNWMAGKSITSLEQLPSLFGAPYRPRPERVETLAKQIAGALRNRDMWSEHTPTEVADAIVRELTIEQGEEFCAAVSKALGEKLRKVTRPPAAL